MGGYSAGAFEFGENEGGPQLGQCVSTREGKKKASVGLKYSLWFVRLVTLFSFTMGCCNGVPREIMIKFLGGGKIKINTGKIKHMNTTYYTSP